MDTSFYLSWLGPPAFGTKPSSNQVLQPLPPVPPVVAPIPIASFDFNNYVADDSTIVNDVSGGDPATINEPLANTYVSDLSNSYLSIYAPDNYPSQTGGIILPSLSNITAIELWLRYPSLGYYGQYFLDARTGSDSSYWINSDSGVDISGAWLGGTGYLNTLSTTIDNTGPNVATTLANDLSGGWCQLIILPSTTISDDVACFVRYTGEQGMPVDIAEILVYDASITSEMVVLMYNARCSRYGLSPVVL